MTSAEPKSSKHFLLTRIVIGRPPAINRKAIPGAFILAWASPKETVIPSIYGFNHRNLCMMRSKLIETTRFVYEEQRSSYCLSAL